MYIHRDSVAKGSTLGDSLLGGVFDWLCGSLRAVSPLAGCMISLHLTVVAVAIESKRTILTRLGIPMVSSKSMKRSGNSCGVNLGKIGDRGEYPALILAKDKIESDYSNATLFRIENFEALCHTPR